MDGTSALVIVVLLVVFLRSLRAGGEIGKMGPAMVLKQYVVEREKLLEGDEPFIRIKGRRAGIIAWILVNAGFDVETELLVNRWEIVFKRGSLNGEIREMVPLSRIASVGGGLQRSVGYLALAVIMLLAGLLLPLLYDFSNYISSTTFFFASAAVAAVLLVAFCLNRSLSLFFETVGGSLRGFKFSPSVLENVPVNIERVRQTTALLDETLLNVASLKKV